MGEAFLDRFLVRVPVTPVSAGAFLRLPPALLQPPEDALSGPEREAIRRAADEVRLGEEVAALLGEARAYLVAEGLYVSDRRWVKIAWLLKVAAATEGRAEVVIWDLWLLPWCTAPDAARQGNVASWVAARLGVREPLTPPRLTRVVEAFEAQLEAERNADELDYDDEGRLRFAAESTGGVGGREDGAAPRLALTRRRRYGALHIGARLRELDDLARRIDGYLAEQSARRQELDHYRAQAIWMDEDVARHADEALASTIEAIRALARRASRARHGFESLPRLAVDPGTVPAPVEREPIER